MHGERLDWQGTRKARLGPQGPPLAPSPMWLPCSAHLLPLRGTVPELAILYSAG